MRRNKRNPIPVVYLFWFDKPCINSDRRQSPHNGIKMRNKVIDWKHQSDMKSFPYIFGICVYSSLKSVYYMPFNIYIYF